MTRFWTGLAALLLAGATMAAPAAAASDDTAAIKAVLATYKTALERRDLTGVDALFAERNEVIESGKVEGSYADYVTHHIGPELGHIQRFTFDDYAVTVEQAGDIAWATETYRYTIVLPDRADPMVRQGVATTVLERREGAWKIRAMHSSSRAPKPAAP
ncbi:hypothetical protein N790_00345 [Arenimonas malthae CC-JY-1]|jgi:uncharacterized protein (TIGR02246 family)|uniref:SnoaL-like domain-containing protein n=1 Tax=Arenimonas malthae CC-JY-1 TaxID=1384054 RepID=A0A091BKE6_9GAMM|nr:MULTISPECIES: SgcJ/EcaC family oxidoreductase [Arenimonas]KFN52251.1 hypothetical protein N790_00345 [Arenimonas malthae CC-JY-1]